MNPPASIESEEASRPTGDEDGLRRRAASATEGLARFVAICETEEIASPQEGQKREPPGISAEQLGQRITLRESYRKTPGTPSRYLLRGTRTWADAVVLFPE